MNAVALYSGNLVVDNPVELVTDFELGHVGTLRHLRRFGFIDSKGG